MLVLHKMGMHFLQKDMSYIMQGQTGEHGQVSIWRTILCI